MRPTSGCSRVTASSSRSQIGGWNPHRFIDTRTPASRCDGSSPSSAVNVASM